MNCPKINDVDQGQNKSFIESINKVIEFSKVIELAWLAGFVDGEGHLGLSHHKNANRGRVESFSPVLSIPNTNLSVLERCQQVLNLGKIYGRSKRGPKWKICRVLQMCGKNAIYAIEMIYPYLFLKKPQADLLLSYAANFPRRSWRTKPLSAEKEQLRREIVETLHKLNKRGENVDIL
jgi:LAGLIDADG endonuclease